MSPLFSQYGIEVVALSKDSVDQAAGNRVRDGLSLQLLSDPDLKVIRQFGLEHHKAIEFLTWTVLGIPLGVPSGYKTMAIPTTLLIDEAGIVRYIDQADDYRIRGDEARVREAVEAVFGPPARQGG